jgi:pilus assembly protein CpaF
MKADAMTRLADRVNGVHESTYQAEGFEASVHKIKEQVLRACSNASIPKPPPR